MNAAAAPLVCIGCGCGCGCSENDACPADEFAVWRCSWLAVTRDYVHTSRGIEYRPGFCTFCKSDTAAVRRWDLKDFALPERAAERARRGLSTSNRGKLREIQHCKSCNARVYWMDTKAGKNMPVDADTVGPDDFTYDSKRHMSHFATCPKAAQHRRVQKIKAERATRVPRGNA